MANWIPDIGVDVTSAFKGVTTPIRDLVDEIHKNGWTLKSVKFKKDQFEAQAQNPHGESKLSYGNTEATAVANLLTKIIRTEYARSPALAKIANWDAGWEDQLAEIAKAYAEAPIYDPKAAPAWQDLGNDCIRRARVLHTQLKVEVTDDPVPYKSMQDLIEDVTKKKHILLSRANADHPVWSLDQVLAYRLVHDVLGHVVTGGDWGWHGENMATQAHMPLVGLEAQKALFTEAIGIAAYGAMYRSFGPQKIAILKDFIEDAQNQFNTPGHGALHPSQTIVPTEIPSIEPTGPSPSRSSQRIASPLLKDPNHEWSSGVTPLPDNGFLWHRDPKSGLDPLDAQGAQETIQSLDSGWQNLTHPDGLPDGESQRQAVVNALRATLLRPRKPEKWATIHYQHLHGLPAGVQDPRRFHDTLDLQREEWNQNRDQAEGAHNAPYWGELQKFKGYIKALNPGLDDRDVNRRVEQELGHMWNEEEERILNDDKDSVLGANALAALVRQNLKKRLRVVTKPKVGQDHDFGDITLYHEAHGQDPELYQDWVGNSLNTLAQVGRYSRELADAAREDYMHHGGKGHHFRKETLALGIPGLGPAEASQAWLHLAPNTSQLAVIDPHMLEVLGHTPEEMNDRDYFKFERELGAGRDASGYNHLPLGLFGHALWDQKNYGDHADYSHLRALNPTHWTQADTTRSPQDSWASPEWWEATQDARDQTGENWRRSVGTEYPSSVYPFQTVLPGHTAAVEGSTPWYTHPASGEMVEGAPGQSLMQHLRGTLGLSTKDVWDLPLEAGKT